MISMDKKYTTRDGKDVRILCVDGGDHAYPVIGLINGEAFAWAANGQFFKGSDKQHAKDLVEVSPYADFKVDEPVMVRDYEQDEWARRYFAGADAKGNPMAFEDGATSWSNGGRRPVCWKQCRRPTPEEL